MEFSQKALKVFESYKILFDNPNSILIPTLYLAQKEFGYLSKDVMEYVATLVHLPPAKVKEVASFYTMLHKKPVGKYEIQICLNITCTMMKSKHLFEHVQKKLNLKVGQTTPDQKFTLSRVECLGACDKAPVTRINDRYYYHVTPEAFDLLLEKCQ